MPLVITARLVAENRGAADVVRLFPWWFRYDILRDAYDFVGDRRALKLVWSGAEQPGGSLGS